jgi:tetratricopeptide (TPR) repeat protein
LWTADEVEWARRVEADLDNIRAAVSWAVAAGETDLAMRIAGAFVTQAAERPVWATASIAEHALGTPGAGEHPWRAIVMGEASWTAVWRGDMAAAQSLVTAALDAQRAGARFSAPAWSYALSYYTAGSLDSISVTLSAEALERAGAAGDRVGTIALRATHALNLAGAGRAAEARAEAEHALAEARAVGQPALIAMGLLALGEALVRSGEHEAGLAALRESVDISNTLNSSWQIMGGQSMLAAAEANYGDPVKAAELMRSLLASARDTSDDFLVPGATYVALGVFNRYGRPDLSARMYGATELARNMSYGSWRWMYEDAIKDARAALGDERYEALAAEGASIPWGRMLDEMIGHLDVLIEHGPPPK